MRWLSSMSRSWTALNAWRAPSFASTSVILQPDAPAYHTRPGYHWPPGRRVAAEYLVARLGRSVKKSTENTGKSVNCLSGMGLKPEGSGTMFLGTSPWGLGMQFMMALVIALAQVVVLG